MSSSLRRRGHPGPKATGLDAQVLFHEPLKHVRRSRTVATHGKQIDEDNGNTMGHMGNTWETNAKHMGSNERTVTTARHSGPASMLRM